ncbi:MAG: hypothetical protein ACR2LT_09085 [Pyrinomonadaceae bacterium]
MPEIAKLYYDRDCRTSQKLHSAKNGILSHQISKSKRRNGNSRADIERRDSESVRFYEEICYNKEGVMVSIDAAGADFPVK